MQEKLGNDGVLFYPSAPFPAVYHYSSYLRPFNFGYTCLFNALRLPVCQVPLGLDKQGLPIGIQVRFLITVFVHLFFNNVACQFKEHKYKYILYILIS